MGRGGRRGADGGAGSGPRAGRMAGKYQIYYWFGVEAGVEWGQIGQHEVTGKVFKYGNKRIKLNHGLHWLHGLKRMHNQGNENV